MNAYTLWNDKIVFIDGWFVYMDGKGNNSIISHNRARMIEAYYKEYQIRMNIDKGAICGDYDSVMKSCDFVKEGHEYVLKEHTVDKLIVGNVNEIPNVLVIPKNIGNVKINRVSKEAFKGETAIEKVIFHNEIKVIESSAFEGCEKLREIEVPENNIQIQKNAFKDTLIPSKEVSYVNNVLVKVEPSYKGVLKVKEGTLAIAGEALKGCTKITRVELPESVETIGEYAFYGCTNLVEIKLPRTMKKIEWYAFANCEALNSIVLPEGISTIYRRMFYKCKNLFKINIPKSVKEIHFDAFEESGLFTTYENSCDTELYIDEWLIHYKADMITNLSVKIGTVGIADMQGRKSKKIKSVELPNSLKYIGADVFEKALINSVRLPSNLISIGQSAFRGAHLEKICIPRSVKKIEMWAFMDCNNISKIIFIGNKTEVNNVAITGRRDKKSVVIIAPQNSTVNEYCKEYGESYNLVFKPFVRGSIKKILIR